MLTMLPPSPWVRNCLIASWAPKNVPLALTSKPRRGQLAELVQPLAGAEDPGVVDEDVEAAELGNGLLDECSHFSGLGDVGLDEDRFAAGLLDRLRGGRCRVVLEASGGRLLVDVADDQLGAFGGAGLGDAAAETGTRSGDNDDLVL